MKLHSLFALAAALFLMGCTQDFNEDIATDNPAFVGAEKLVFSAEGASAGVLAIKVTPAEAERIESGATRSEGTRSGIESLDKAFDRIQASGFERIFQDTPFEQALRRHGMHLWYKVYFPTEQDLNQAARALAASEATSVVEFMHRPIRPHHRPVVPATEAELTRAETLEFPTDDPYSGMQWHYNNTGSRSGFRAGADINLFNAWEICSGDREIIVAIMDGPVDVDHPDLAAAMWVNTTDSDPALVHGANFCSRAPSDIDLDSDDSYGHGCHVAGTVGAVNNNAEGVCGVAGGKNGRGGVRLMGCQIFSSNRQDNNPEPAADALIWAANRGALIAQCSFGYEANLSLETWKNTYSYEREAIDYFVNYERTNSPIDGGLAIFAAGNDGNANYYGTMVKDKALAPGSYNMVVGVAATSPDFTPGGYTCYGSWVDISAPGGDSDNFGQYGMILSTVPFEVAKTGYGWYEGTSMACPHVSGVAALGLSYAKELGKQFTTGEFRDLLLASTNSIESYLVGSKETEGYSYEKGRYVPVTIQLEEYQNKMGGGLVDAYRMLMAVEGTPVVVAGVGNTVEVPLQMLLGGEAVTSEFSFTVDPMQSAEKLGLTYEITTDNRLLICCEQAGADKVKLLCTIGDTPIERTFAVICREQMASNGGWL